MSYIAPLSGEEGRKTPRVPKLRLNMFVRSFIPVLFLAVLAPPIAATDKSSSLAMKKISCQSSHADIDCHKGTATSISCYVLDECPLRGFKCTRPAEANDKHLLLWAECIDGDDKLLGGGSAGSSNDHHKFSKVVDRFLPKAASHESHFFKTHISPRFAAGNPLIIQQRYAKPGCDPSDLILVEYMPADANCYPETQQVKYKHGHW